MITALSFSVLSDIVKAYFEIGRRHALDWLFRSDYVCGITSFYMSDQILISTRMSRLWTK